MGIQRSRFRTSTFDGSLPRVARFTSGGDDVLLGESIEAFIASGTTAGDS
jgi:hypothetical protein